MDQAYTQVASRCGRLMDDAYRLGFEIVKKNEATSKVLGVFAFRVAKELYYVPVFFLNGIIRGADLLHRFTPKRFVANTPDWADYLINQATTEQGRSVPRSEVSRIQDNVRMDRIVWPPVGPGSFKRASFGTVPGGPTGVNRGGDGQGWTKLADAKKYKSVPVTIGGAAKRRGRATPPGYVHVDKTDAELDKMSDEEYTTYFDGLEDLLEREDVEETNKRASVIKRAGVLKGVLDEISETWTDEHGHGRRWVLSPEEMEKFASDRIPEDAATNWEGWIDDLCVQDRAVPLHLPEYMAKSAAAFDGLINEIEKSPQLADLLMRNYTQEQIFPERTAEKKASASPDIFFQIHTDVSTMTGHEKFASADRENFCRVGYFIEDNRPMEKLAKIVERPISEGVETVGDNGAYEIMKIDGSYVKAIVGTCIPIPRLENDMGSGLCDPVPCGSWCGEPNLAQTPERNIITWDGAESVLSTRDLAYGKHVMDAGDPGIEASAMKSGKVYCLISPAGEITSAFMVQEIKSGKDQIKTFKIATSQWSTQSLVLNPDATQAICDTAGVINSNYRAIKLDHKTDKECDNVGGEGEHWTLDHLILGNESSVNTWLFGQAPIKRASVRFDKQADAYQLRLDRGGNVKTAHEVAIANTREAMRTEQGRADLAHDDTVSAWMPRTKMAAFLAVNLLTPGVETEDWLNEATEKQAAVRDLLFPDEFMKQATMMRMINNPPYQLDSDSQLGVPVEYGPQTQIVTANYVTPQPVNMRTNEVLDSARGVQNENREDDFLMHADPYAIAEMAAKERMPHVLDHAVIGSLASTYDAASAMDPILVDMERGLDATGRAVFLLLWKPNDFRAMYGADDIPNIENKLLSVFKSQAAILLDLLQKNRGDKSTSGSPPVG